MMDNTADNASSESDLVNPVLVAMADTNSAFLKFTTSSPSLAAAYSAVDVNDDDDLLAMMMAPLRLWEVADAVTSPRTMVDDGGVVEVVNADTPPW